MAMELELKLMIQKDHLNLAYDFLNAICQQEPECHAEPSLQLMNGYFDTQDKTLMNAGIALRIRAINERYIQTLKTRGSNRIGMHARGEWEWDIKEDKLELERLTDEMLPESLHDRAWEKGLEQVFRTDFERQIWLIKATNTLMEVVCDQGEVTSPYGKDQISELELELKSGDEIALYDFASRLALTVPVQVSTVSKAQKGVRLKDNKIELPDALSENASAIEQGAFWYETWLVYWEAMCFYDDIAFLTPVYDAMDQLANFVSPLLAQDLVNLETLMKRKMMQLDSESPLPLTALLETGQSMLAIARWLNRQNSQ
ncbi:adenylate cyclase [Marinomonas sp. SBI22]|uniref:CYTH domain-containing protein n=1 Tax=unclassified Marinomonas TaxID=196814 RepID=UPI0007AEEA94|nr:MULTISPECIES: CYTH domain-containing protein [unclassified Marinomonas]KZM40869.1 adenylate cyclase [Marinomonas sp. SBI22]KZM42709.1 adenylate cyclase [Marinomonas sp. SBI8L]